MGDSKIQWTDAVWNPVRGCSHISAGCANCYAARQAHRFDTCSERSPYHGLTKPLDPWGRVRWSGEVRFVPEMLDAPLRWRRPRRVFVNSMSDLFHESVTDEQIAAVFGVMAACPQHVFQVLTKRPERMARWFEWFATMSPGLDGWPLPNVWLGVSCEDQRAADERIPLLLQTPAAVRFVSCEPLLGPVNFARSGLAFGVPLANGSRWFGSKPGIDWVIVGGESGPGARPCDVEWIRSIVRQCRAAGVPVFVKQLGSCPQDHGTGLDWPDGIRFRQGVGPGSAALLRHSKGGDPAEWPEDLRVRQWPEVRP